MVEGPSVLMVLFTLFLQYNKYVNHRHFVYSLHFKFTIEVLKKCPSYSISSWKLNKH